MTANVRALNAPPALADALLAVAEYRDAFTEADWLRVLTGFGMIVDDVAEHAKVAQEYADGLTDWAARNERKALARAEQARASALLDAQFAAMALHTGGAA